MAKSDSTTDAPVYVRVVPDGTSYCTIHGEQPGLSCAACDQANPDAVSARAIPGTAPAQSSDDFNTAVQKEVAKQLAAQQKSK